MGKVYEAEFRDSKQLLAVKFLHKSFQNNSHAVQRLLDEAETIQRLRHPGIVKVYGTGQTSAGIYFIVMHLIKGLSLAQHPFPISTATIVRCAIEVAHALQHAHDNGIVHCDLKPSNVMIDDSGHTVLTDFGLANVLNETERRQQSIAGTAPWMAPEQVDGHFGAIGPQTDVYGLGALLYTLLCGRPPYVGTRTADVLSMVISGCCPPATSTFRKDVPLPLENLCTRCLAKRPTDRPATAAEVATRLEDILTRPAAGID